MSQVSVQFSVGTEGFKLKDVRKLTGAIEMNAVRAINRGADRGRTLAAKLIREEIDFPAAYLNPSQGRLVVAQRATRGIMQARIEARRNPTQLSRFRLDGTPSGKSGVTVRVKPGMPKFGKRFVLIAQSNGNFGVAIRLRPGEALHGSNTAARPNWKGLTFLYAPSVDQAFGTLRGTVSADISKFIQGEIVRLMNVAELQ